MNGLALFAGAGGGILGGLLLDWRTVCAVEIDPYCAGVLLARQNDGVLPPFPIWDDVRTFDGAAWRGIVDVVSGGFPCQDISCAGRGAGIDGERSGLWSEMARIVGEVRPRYVLVENVPALTHRGLAEFSATWPDWGTMRNGVAWARSTPERLTDGCASGLWPTPRAEEPGRTTKGYGRGLAELIEGKQQLWPTPQSFDAKGISRSQEALDRAKKKGGCANLREAVARFPTPKERDWKGQSQRGIHGPMDALPNVDNGAGKPIGGQLNPEWVEWLMGWPVAWTDLKPLGMDKFQRWCDSHGMC